MLIDVIDARIQADFQLMPKFRNGEKRRFDMRPLLALKPWNRIATLALFNCLRVDYGTVVWPGNIDIAPETLYDNSVPVEEAAEP